MGLEVFENYVCDGQMELIGRTESKLTDLNDIPDNKEIFESIITAMSKIKNPCYANVLCSISGGSDSDLLIDMFSRIDVDRKIKYIFFDTGLEYDATKKHLEELKKKYGINIEKEPASKSIPSCCKRYGQPFISKQVSEWISRLQKHNFTWEDEPFETLLNKFPRCRAALKWWCNEWPERENGGESSYNIAYNRGLKEFMVAYPPEFKISNMCCHYAKKDVAKKYKIKNSIDLSIVGIRKAEGGARSTSYKNCFTADVDGTDEYRPIFWYKNDTKEAYVKHFKVKHSDCYCKYGLKRTGCAGCPYGNDFEFELEVIKRFEPKLYAAVNNIFGESYAYTRQYYEFRRKMKADNPDYQQMELEFIS